MIRGFSFDFSRKATGVVAWRDQQPVKAKVWELPDDYLGVQLSKLERALTRSIKGYNPDWLAYETASPTNFRFASLQLAMIGSLHRLAYDLGDITIMGIAAASAKKTLTGSGRAKKPEMLAAARALYPHLDIATDDIADAIAVGLTFYQKVELSQIQSE